MSVGAYVLYNTFRKKLGTKVMSLSADTFKLALFQSSSNAATLTLSTLGSVTNEIASAGGYTLHGRAMTGAAWAAGTSAKQYKWTISAPIFTASGANLSAIKFAVIVDNSVGASAGLNPLVAVCTLSTARFSISNGNTMTITNPSTGVITLA